MVENWTAVFGTLSLSETNCKGKAERCQNRLQPRVFCLGERLNQSGTRCIAVTMWLKQSVSHLSCEISHKIPTACVRWTEWDVSLARSAFDVAIPWVEKSLYLFFFIFIFFSQPLKWWTASSLSRWQPTLPWGPARQRPTAGRGAEEPRDDKVCLCFFGLALSASVSFLSYHINCMVMSDRRIVEHAAFVKLPTLTLPLLEWLCGTSLLRWLVGWLLVHSSGLPSLALAAQAFIGNWDRGLEPATFR